MPRRTGSRTTSAEYPSAAVPPIVAAILYAVVGLMIHVEPAAVRRDRREHAARSALICAAVDPVDVIAVAPFVIAAGRRFALSVTVFVKNCASRIRGHTRDHRLAYGALRVRVAEPQEFVRQHDDLAGLVAFLLKRVIRGRRRRRRQPFPDPGAAACRCRSRAALLSGTARAAFSTRARR